MEKPVDPQFSVVKPLEHGPVSPGVVLARKRVGPPAFSSVQRVLDLMKAGGGRQWPSCHGGALDPFAEGLMLVLVGPATKLFPFFHEVPKTYVATVKWGAETANGDLLGAVTSTGDASALTPEKLDAALINFLGWTDQVPPTTSNKRVNGERAWAKAARGEVFELPPSKVFLHAATWRSHALPDSSVLELTCRGGYYVRSLARDLGRQLGCFAHLSALERTQIGPWKCPEADQLEFIAGADLVPWLPVRVLTDDEAGQLNREQPLGEGPVQSARWSVPRGFPPPSDRVRALHLGKLRAILEKKNGGWNPLLQFRPPF